MHNIFVSYFTARLVNLNPNSKHVIYIVAIGQKGESLPSETLVAFTNPALSPLLDVCRKIDKKCAYL